VAAGETRLERAETLEPESRTLIVTHRMRSLLGRAAEGSIVNEIRRFELFTDGRAATIALQLPDLIIERRTLIQGLAAEAQRAGAKIELGGRFHALHANGNGLAVEVERCADGSREEIHTDTVVGGDGATSRGARNGSAGPGNRATAERHGPGHGTRVVRSAGHALFLLADS
jgi:flavin-dependent dehydrogenase